MILTKSELLDSLQKEVRILLHLASKIDRAQLDYRPTPKQRSTLELLQVPHLHGSDAPSLREGRKDGRRRVDPDRPGGRGARLRSDACRDRSAQRHLRRAGRRHGGARVSRRSAGVRWHEDHVRRVHRQPRPLPVRRVSHAVVHVPEGLRPRGIEHQQSLGRRRSASPRCRRVEFRFDAALPVLERTPGVLRGLLADLPPSWTNAVEGPNTWSPFDVVGHLIHGERDDWMPRVEHLLRHGDAVPFPPFDREAMFAASQGRSLGELLDTFDRLRAESLARLDGARVDRCRRVAPRTASGLRRRDAGAAPVDVGRARPGPHQPDRPRHGAAVHGSRRALADVPLDPQPALSQLPCTSIAACARCRDGTLLCGSRVTSRSPQFSLRCP